MYCTRLRQWKLTDDENSTFNFTVRELQLDHTWDMSLHNLVVSSKKAQHNAQVTTVRAAITFCFFMPRLHDSRR